MFVRSAVLRRLLGRVLLLAGRNADVDRLNAGARAHARTTGELVGDDVDYGPGIALAVGDVVRVRANDYRSRRGAGPDVLNGYRAVVTEQDPALGARIAWRAPGPDGPELTHAWMSREAIAAGELTHGYAMTIASAQGLTSDVACVYAAGADAYTIYPGITRARQRTDTWLPLDALEDDTTRIRLGPVADRAERLERAVTAYADRVERDRPDTVVDHELQEPAAPLAPAPAAAAPDDRMVRVREALDRTEVARRRSEVLAQMRTRRFGRPLTQTLLPNAERYEQSADQAERDVQERVHAADTVLRTARAGHGPNVRLLEERYRRAATAVGHLDRADHHQAVAEHHQRHADDARARWRELDRLHGLGRLSL